MDSLLANYASSDDDEEAKEVSRAIPSLKLSSLSNTLPPPKSSSFFSSLPSHRISNSSSSSSSSSPSSSLFASFSPPKSQLPNHSLNGYKREDDGGKPPNQPQSSSISSSLPRPKIPSSSAFSSLPAPKSQSRNPSNKLSLDPKRVVHFTLPLNPSMLQSLDSDDDEEEKGRKVRKDTSSSSTPKALTSMLPAPKSSRCIAPAQSFGGSRRSSLQMNDPSANCPQGSKAENEVGSFDSYPEYGAKQGMAVGYEAYGSYSAEQGVSDYENYKNDDGNLASEVLNPASVSSEDSTYASIPSITGWEQDNGNNFGYRSYMDSWANVSSGATRSEILDIGRIVGKRGRTDIATEIVEVKQDELMKNRPREDQIKSTGIAFGPAYQVSRCAWIPNYDPRLNEHIKLLDIYLKVDVAAVLLQLKSFGALGRADDSRSEQRENARTRLEKPAPSAKGKPSKLHKRKHQIGSLYYDLKQKEMELAERRSKGFLTKAETQAKYGW